MSEQKLNFVSPGVYIDEIDNSQLPKSSPRIGPVVIGRAERGPGLRPVKVKSFSEFVNIFGNPIAGQIGGDVWRDGNYLAPTYGAYAAQAWLKNNDPVTFVRLLGAEHQDKSAAGKAGWQTSATTSTVDASTNGGAFGLFIANSGSSPVTGALAAIFYVDSGAVILSGNIPSGDPDAGDAKLIESYDSSCTFIAEIRNAAGTVTEKTRFNFTPSSNLYARKVFNTNPTLTNSTITNTSQLKTYWLGETFERHLADYVTLGSKCFGVILALASSSVLGADYRMGTQVAKSGWVFSQDLTTNSGSYDGVAMTRLFRFLTLDSGEWEQKKFKVSIEDIKAPLDEYNKYGTFTVLVRASNDSDNAKRIVERFTNCTLNPNSENYIAKKIGDRYTTWSDSERVYTWLGNYDNKSNYIRVSMNEDVDAGATNAELLPFGCLGPPRFKGFTLYSGSTGVGTFGADIDDTFINSFVVGSGSVPYGPGFGKPFFVEVGVDEFTGSFYYPKIALRSGSFDGTLANPTDAYFGADSTKSSTTKFEDSWMDLVRALPSGIDSYDPDSTTTEYSWVFSLDDLKPYTVGSTVGASWASGSRAAGTSFSAVSASWSASLDRGFDRFTIPLFGGFDGLDITEQEPFRNSQFTGTPTELISAPFNSIKRAIDSVADPEETECNIIVMPGLTHSGLTSHLLNVCEDRRDSLGIIDLANDYVPATEGTSETAGLYTSAIATLKDRGLNTSYGCTYYPWVQIRDTINGAILWVPPSIAALGTFAYSEKKTELWFAPAGFTRGGLTEGAAGIPVINIRERLRQPYRDKLYAANINPIATFTAEGIVVLGQKTLQVTPSALDRINVRRLMNYIKKEISRRCKGLLFEPNVSATWDRFRDRVEPFLRDIKIRFGLQQFKVVLDATTTTADLIDRNIMYAKVFLKPTRAIEFIAVDFSITDSGASFED